MGENVTRADFERGRAWGRTLSPVRALGVIVSVFVGAWVALALLAAVLAFAVWTFVQVVEFAWP